MRQRPLKILLAITLVLFVTTGLLQAETATLAEAGRVAANWLSLVVAHHGDWNGTEKPTIKTCENLQHNNSVVGFVCHVDPKGFILVSRIKGLAPVKAFSTSSNFCTASDQGMSGLLKQKMARVMNTTETKTRNRSGTTAAQASVFEIDYSDRWTALLAEPDQFSEQASVDQVKANYADGECLIDSIWHQSDPYNRQCPTPAEVGSSICTDERCAVGCTALAAGQIMQYWAWPPAGVGAPYEEAYDWANIPNVLDGNSTQAQIYATANLVREIGHSADMDYCGKETPEDACLSFAYHADMRAAYEDHFRYSSYAITRLRSEYSQDEWWDEIMQQLNSNQPIQYEVPGHSLVCDGWKVSYGMRMYHMNYGWADGTGGDSCWNDYEHSNVWYTLDALPCSDLTGEGIIINIFPAPSLGGSVSGYIPEDLYYKYRYFNADCTGTGAIFGPGQWLQFLHRIVLSANTGSSVAFQGTEEKPTRLFSRGDIKKGFVISDGELRLYDGGQLRFY